MAISNFLSHRLHNHHISHTAFAQPHEAVAWFGAMQAQDYPHSKWAVGLRCLGATDASIEKAIVDRTIVRTWAVRGTLQLVAAQDVRWLVGLVAARLVANMATSEVRRFNLDAAAFVQAERVLEQALRGGQPLTRKQVYDALEQYGISTDGQRGYHILWHAALHGLICQGAPQGKSETFVLLDEWLPASNTLKRDEAAAELARRYFQSHGPATLADFTWWSGLTVGEARAGLDGASAWLAQDTLDGKTVWLPRDVTPTNEPSPTAHLLPGFDEYLLGYTDRTPVMAAVHKASAIHSNGIFRPTVVVDGQIVGTWGRKMAKGELVVTPTTFAPMMPQVQRAIEVVAEQYRLFMNTSSS